VHDTPDHDRSLPEAILDYCDANVDLCSAICRAFLDWYEHTPSRERMQKDLVAFLADLEATRADNVRIRQTWGYVPGPVSTHEH